MFSFGGRKLRVLSLHPFTQVRLPHRGDADGGEGGGSQICTAVRLSWQPITPVQLHAMPSCPPVNRLEQAAQPGFVAGGMDG